MKNILKIMLLTMAGMSLGSCDNFFITDPDDIYNTDDYIGSQSEIYSGFLGIITKMQAVGDQAILLTDTRADYIEPTANAPQELREIYNYEQRQGNEYADPRGYYDVIISCNDYLSKLIEYKNTNPEVVDSVHYKGLIGGTLRIKAWSYFTLGKIYGKAVYFDEPLTEYQSMKDFPVLDLDQLLNKCRELLEVGVEGIDGSNVVNWAGVINPSDPKDDQLVYWAFMTPDYAGLLGEICLWMDDYQKVVDLIWPVLNEALVSASDIWSLSDLWRGKYASMFSGDANRQSKFLISAIVYNYNNNQTNRLISYFENIFPAQYYLRPSEYGMQKYKIQERKDEGPEGDTRRGGRLCYQNNGEYVMHRFLDEGVRPAYRNDVHINIYRAHDYHLMLIEAFNHLKHWDEAESMLNDGVLQRWLGTPIKWNTYGGAATWGANWNGNKGSLGVRGANDLKGYKLPAYDDDTVSDEEKIRLYDEAILNEILLEFPCEGKVYPAMIRFARRYNNDFKTFVADKIVPKYPAAIQGSIESKILAGEYFVPWDLQNQ